MSQYDIQDLREEYEKAVDMPYKPDFTKPELGTIFDKYQTVIWNEEEVQRQRDAWDAERERLVKIRNAALDAVEDKIITYIAEETKLPEIKCQILWDYVYAEHRSDIHDMFCYLEDYTDLIYNLLH